MIFLLNTVIAFLVAIGVLVAVHEYGHFWMARRLGIRVLRFSIGFGKTLWSRKGADGTEYAFSAIPLGGYVKLLDEREGSVEPSQLSSAYSRRPPWQRILVLLAGPFANFLFAVLAYWVLFVAGVPALKPVLGEIAPDSIAAQAGLRPGDEIVGVSGEQVTTREGAVLAILDRVMSGEPIEVRLRSEGGERGTNLRIEGDRRSPTASSPWTASQRQTSRASSSGYSRARGRP
jgi:regulator of sigma E protease